MNDNELQLLETLETVTKQMAAAVTRCSRDFRYLWANQAYADWLQRPLNEVVGRSILDVLGKDAFEALLPHFNRVLTGEKVIYERETNFHGIGRRWIAATYTPTLDADGVADGWVAVVTDITERKRVERELLQTNERLNLAMEAGRIGEWEANLKNGKSLWFGQTHALLGINPEVHSSTQEFWNRVHQEDRGWLKDALQESIRSRTGFSAEFRVVWPDGSVHWLRSQGRFFYEADGQPERMLGMSIDVTERKLAEEAIKESEQRFRLVADSAPVMIWMSGLDKRPTYFNRVWLDFTGKSKTDLQNDLAGIVHPEDYQKCHETYCHGFDQRQPFRKECRLRRHDGQYRWMVDIGVPRFHEDGSFAGYIGSCVDITEQKLAEEALSSISRRLIQAQEQERSRIARELHDDISQRLALVAMSLDHQRCDLRSTTKEMRPVMRSASKQISELVSDVHMMSHRLHSSKLDTIGLAAAAAGFCRELSKQRKVEIDFQCDGIPKELPKAIALCMFRVLQEALQNAARHSGTKQFKVQLAERTNQIALTICDEGRGFDPTEAIKGKGIGLASMVERLKLVGGELLIDVGPNGGTTIRASVPFAGRSKPASADD